MDDIKKTELWNQMVSKHTAEAKAKAEAAGNVAKEATTDGAASGTPAAGSEALATTATPEGDQLTALTKRFDALEARFAEIGKNVEAKFAEIGKSFEAIIAKATEITDAAVAKAAGEQATAQATAKAELDKTIASAQALVNDAKAAADRIEALAPRGTGKRIDEIVAKGKDALAAKTEPELLAENAPKVLKMAEGAK